VTCENVDTSGFSAAYVRCLIIAWHHVGVASEKRCARNFVLPEELRAFIFYIMIQLTT